jgi:hypothetical protein
MFALAKRALGTTRRIIKWHPIWSPRLDTVSMVAYLALIVVTIIATLSLQEIGAQLNTNGVVLAAIFGGATLIVAVQVGNDIRRYRRTRWLLANEPGSADRELAKHGRFYLWVVRMDIPVTDDFALMSAFVRHEEWQRRKRLMVIGLSYVLAVAADIALVPPLRMYTMITEYHVLCGRRHCRFCHNQGNQ